MNIGRKHLIFFVLLSLLSPLSVSAGSLKLYAAGSLKEALNEIGAAYKKVYESEITSKFGPSGILEKAIEAGETPDIFASANMTLPETLAAKGWGGPVVLFTRNKICALVQHDINVTPNNLLTTLLEPSVRVGTSTPKADPSGDYAWELFRKGDKIRKESFAILSAKALQLSGGPDSVKAPDGRNQYAWIMAEKKADIFLTYCTNAVLARNEETTLKIVDVPDELSVGADYGLLISNSASIEAWRFGMYILSPEGQKILKEYGFQALSLQQAE